MHSMAVMSVDSKVSTLVLLMAGSSVETMAD